MIALKRRLGLLPLVRRFPLVDVRGRPYIEFEENITVRGHVYIGPGAFWSAMGGIELGNNIAFGPNTVIWSYNHNYDQGDAIPFGHPGCDRPGKVVIEDNVWVGLGAMILAGVTIGEGAVIAAGAVVTHNVTGGDVVAGNPARVVKHRDMEHYERLKASGAFLLQKGQGYAH
jgi:acetyltransferase-like isoleucine patch superfamily enzyme